MPTEHGVMPYIQVATFCETALQEANGTTSIIRIVDRHVVSGSTEQMQPTSVTMTLAVILKSGDFQGQSTVSIQPNTPSKKELPPLKFGVLFEGQERGVGLLIKMGILVQETGLYWFDVLVDSAPLTRIPLRILYQQQVMQGGPPAAAN